MKRNVYSAVAIASIASVAGWVGSARSAEIVMAPHRAIYDFTMGSSEGQKGPSAATGQIAYEMRGDPCTGYSVNFRQSTEVTPTEGDVRSADVRSATFEDANHKTFRFRYDTYSDGQIVKTVEGKAERSDGGVSINITKPVTEKVDLGVEVTFPVHQTFRTLAAAMAGKSVLEMKTYDASDDGKKIYHSLQVISAPLSKPAGDLTANVPAMKDMKRWRIVASNFNLQNIDAPPLYVLKFDMWENGVSSNVTIDYGSFTLVGKMSKLEMFPVKPCKK